jgi:hypothetical protein
MLDGVLPLHNNWLAHNVPPTGAASTFIVMVPDEVQLFAPVAVAE